MRRAYKETLKKIYIKDPAFHDVKTVIVKI